MPQSARQATLDPTEAEATEDLAARLVEMTVADVRHALDGGTATAVAASLAVLGLAEETGGSIQNPASAQGLVGIKPSFGLVPNAGVMPLAGSTRDVVGPITRCVRDAALTLDA